MRRTVAERVPSALRTCTLTACLIATAALLPPLLILPASGTDDSEDQRLQNAFTNAAREFHVPRSVLMGVSYMQSRWDTHPGAPSIAGGYGPMHLVDSTLARTPDRSPAPGPPVPDGGQPDPLTGTAFAAGGHAVRPADLERAARLIKVPAKQLRTDAVANVRGGAALLAATQRHLGKPLSTDPEDWWQAVERFPGTRDITSATTYANDVFGLIRRGAHRTTAEGQEVDLPATPGISPHPGPQAPKRPKEVECPTDLACDWLAAPYEKIDEDGDYGNHDLADRPRDQRIEYIVIHDTESTLPNMFKTVQDPTEASWHYSIRSSDGHITQHVRTKDEAWHSGSQFVNARSIGIEHEGFLAHPGTWYTEQMYRSSARLVRYLAKKYDVPMDRQHIFGHDNVPSPTGDSIPDMHEDPGPFWDWRHYFDLLGAPLKATAGPDSPMVMILPDYATHKPRYTGCEGDGSRCLPHGSSAVRLYTRPDEKAPLIQDPGRRPDGDPSTEDVSDLGSRASTGQTFAVADRRGEWTAIWYQGNKAWFKNPAVHPTAVGASGRMVTPKEGLDEIPVFGRALPEEDAYPEGMEEEDEAPLPYTLRAGQRYVTQSELGGSYVERSTISATPQPVVVGQDRYYEIQFGHRLAYVRADDVDVLDTHADGTTGAAGSEAVPDGQ
ncbi:N-acetylmuramoyl-L-alanine amidase [Streptomyces sp. Ag109_O5-10]|uniref:N-acetylmuramoyl-L-alanine amidase n=1 Tax=Streptomyces sp. Ag109_O5-10 TaxID=1855349 RepID=UPI000898A293|nr:peptidoglycan recognition family protein [Streptomyces sp. Ag109_O5-10]SED93534.1 N-acetylmuramoyl-L-alanine amidase [Streptomyces sp. Ag109_O5-10]